jgi:hypothetical protein
MDDAMEHDVGDAFDEVYDFISHNVCNADRRRERVLVEDVNGTLKRKITRNE